jgi:hypothetical protein
LFVNNGGGGTGVIGVNDGVMEVGGGGALLITLASFGQIPLLPGANPTAPNQAARKQYVDDTATAWSVGGWFIDDPSTFPVGDETRLCYKD